MIKKFFHIIRGWGKATGILPVSTAEKKLSDMRMKICGQCEHSKSSKILEILNGNAHYEFRLRCTQCGCPCLEKTLVADENCPVSKW